MATSSSERTGTTELPEPELAPVEAFTAEDVLEAIRETCIFLDPEHARAYRGMDASHVRAAVRFNGRLLEAHREYQRVYRVTRRGRREHARALHRHLDIIPLHYTVIAQAWALLPATILDALDPVPDPSRRSPLRTAS